MEGMEAGIPTLAFAEASTGAPARVPVAMSGAPSGRDERIADLFVTHYDGLCRLATLLLGDRAGAEEVVQEAFLRTFSGWWRIRQPDRAQWYLRTAVLNQCRSRLRRRGTEDRSNRTIYATDPERQAESFGVGSTGASDDALVVMKAVHALPPRQRETIILRYYEDLPEIDIAKLLSCSVGTVKSQLSKARASLHAALAPQSPDGEDA
jgi:RNA polymerase sigma-70 factor (sigma-E family)